MENADLQVQIHQYLNSYKLLPVGLDSGLKESDFLEMTISEIQRHIDSYNRCQKQRLQEQANFTYAQAGLIGRAIGRLLDDKNTFPNIEEVFPELFDTQQKEEEKQTLENMNNFLAFVAQHNASFKQKEGENK